MFLSIFSIYFGSVWIFRSSASIVLNCQADGCTFNINTPYGFVPKKSINGIIQTADKPKRKTTIRIKRDQLVRADNIKWDPESQAIVENYGLGSPTYSSQQPSEDEVEGGEGVGDLGDSRRPTKPWNKRTWTSTCTRAVSLIRMSHYTSVPCNKFVPSIITRPYYNILSLPFANNEKKKNEQFRHQIISSYTPTETG
jgi:hypothetical protein